MQDLTLIIPTKREVESLPIFLKEIENYYVNREKEIEIQIDNLNLELERRISQDTEAVREELLNLEQEIKKINEHKFLPCWA